MSLLADLLKEYDAMEKEVGEDYIRIFSRDGSSILIKDDDEVKEREARAAGIALGLDDEILKETLK